MGRVAVKLQEKPVVSVVVPTRDRAHFLDDALKSVMRATDRVSPSCSTEVIVVDDWSTDSTEEVAARYPIRFVKNRGSGVAAARNTGISTARGRLIAFLDDDDIWLPHHLQVHLDKRREFPGVGITYSQGMLANEALKPISIPYPKSPLPNGWIQRYAFSAALQQFNTMLIERELFQRVNCFDETLEVGEDLDMIQKLAPCTEFAGIEDVTTLWRQHPRPGAGSYRGWRRRRRISQESYKRGLVYLGTGLPLRARLARQVQGRGWAAFEAVVEGERCLRHGQRAEAAKLLLAAIGVSAPHAFFRIPGFWRFAARVLL
jgi:hypothetical protein